VIGELKAVKVNRVWSISNYLTKVIHMYTGIAHFFTTFLHTCMWLANKKVTKSFRFAPNTGLKKKRSECDYCWTPLWKLERKAWEVMERLQLKLSIWALLVVLLVNESYGRNICPADTGPCTCTVKSKGLVVICEHTDMSSVRESMQLFKQHPGTIISYLTLRKTNMPRLPDFIFLGKFFSSQSNY